MITEELIELVKEEAQKLREHATEGELQRLGFVVLEPELADSCIYGQMTGHCCSPRAKQLLSECASIGIANDDYQAGVQVSKGFVVDREEESTIIKAFSPIEFYICQSGAKNAALIAYLKGETADLEI